MHRRAAFLAALLCGLCSALPSSAAPKHRIALRLAYEAPVDAKCPDADELALMIAAEFGYLVVRTDVSPVLNVEIRRTGSSFEAELSAPGPAEGAAPWQGKTDTQGSCRELAYDIAALVKMRLGPQAWASEEPPKSLAAPPDIEVGHPAIHSITPRMPESLASLLPWGGTALAPSSSPEEPAFQAEVALGFAFSPYALPSVGIGGNGWLALRWPRFTLGMDVRGLITPALGIGEPPAPGRTTLATVSFLPCAVAYFLDLCGIVNASRMDFLLDPPYRLQSADLLSMGFGARVAARWSINKRFTLIGYMDATAELRNLVFQGDASLEKSGVAPYWRSPLGRIVLGVAIGASLRE